MADRPGAFKLASASTEFVFQNLSILFYHLRIILPLLVLMELINTVGSYNHMDWMVFATLIPSIYLYACFALSWHRSSLAGASTSHAVNPFSPQGEDTKFIGLFFGITFLPIAVGVLVGMIIGGATYFNNPVIIWGIIIALVPFSIYGLIQLIRLSFKLPARSLGVHLTFQEAKQASRGLVSKILMAGGLIVAGAWVVFFIYALVVGLTVGVITVGTEPGIAGQLFLTLLMAIPLLVGTVVVTAINITILSKAYQWGMQNNAAEI